MESTGIPLRSPVRVTGARGYGDFDGELLAESVAVDDRGPLAVVGFVWEGKQDFAVVPQSCVAPVTGAGGG